MLTSRRRLGWRRASRGASSLEFALMTPVLALIAFGAFDLGSVAQTSMKLERAARAGAQFGQANPSDLAGIRAATKAAWPDLTDSDVPLPTATCTCSGTAVLCTAPCAAGLEWTVTITANKAVGTTLLRSLSARTGTAVLQAR